MSAFAFTQTLTHLTPLEPVVYTDSGETEVEVLGQVLEVVTPIGHSSVIAVGPNTTAHLNIYRENSISVVHEDFEALHLIRGTNHTVVPDGRVNLEVNPAIKRQSPKIDDVGKRLYAN